MRKILCALCLAGCAARQHEPRIETTSGAIAVANLSAQIDGQEQLLRRRPGAVPAMAALVELLQTRAQYTGSVGDFRRMERLGEEAVRSSPRDPQALLVRASTRAALHRFAAALSDLDAAGDDAAAPSLRASILQAQGRNAEALELRRRAVREYANTRNLAALAAAEGAAGEFAGALRDFTAAERAYRDTSPFPLAWIDFQRGLVFERQGHLDDARAAYAAAADRLPQFAQAQAHLAGMLALRGDRKRAEAILRPLAGLDDPEYEGQLAGLLASSEEGARLRASAAERYESLLRGFPEAFADHAARFFLAFDPARALSLARLDVQVRPTLEAFDLALSAAVASGAIDCSLAARARAAAPESKRIELMAARTCTSSGAR